MKFDMLRFRKTLEDNNIIVIYCGPVWAGGIDGMAEMLQKRLDFDDISVSASQSVFSVFVEQMNNILMHSAEKERFRHSDNALKEAAKGVFILGVHDKTYFIKTGNVVTEKNAKILKESIDHLNTLDKNELRLHYKEHLKADNSNLESKGAGIGLIEIARRATSKVEYEFKPHGDGLLYFTMYVTI
jgi:hypothetical protein